MGIESLFCILFHTWTCVWVIVTFELLYWRSYAIWVRLSFELCNIQPFIRALLRRIEVIIDLHIYVYVYCVFIYYPDFLAALCIM